MPGNSLPQLSQIRKLVVSLFGVLLLVLLPPLAQPAPKPKEAPVKVNVRAGFHDSPFSLEISCSTPAAILLYTLDGAEPRQGNSFEYSKPFKISSNTVLRCAAFKEGRRVSPVMTRTYLFLEQVLRQPPDPPGYPAGPGAWKGRPSVYGMYPRIVNDPVYRARIQEAFKSLAIVSIACSSTDLFSPEKGIYVNPTQRGESWERPCSAEFILTNGVTAFQIDCGIRVQGNQNRVPAKTPKHAFRLLFKEKYGASKLRYPVFPETSVQKFDTLILRADYNNSWVHWDERHRVRAQRVRDAWMKDSQRAMGWVSGHNRFTHLFLNGLYWGVYDFAERPDANFAAAYWGGNSEDYDVINEGQVKDGKADAFNQLNSVGNLARNSQYESLKQQLDMTEFMDYLLLQFYSGNQDIGEEKNWYMIRRRTPPGPFSFLVWDGEQIFHDLRDDTVSEPYETPFRLDRELRGNAEFRLAFADRVQKHFFANGALTPSAVATRWQKRAAEVDLPMIAESARWGYCRRNPPYSHDQDYLQEQKRLLTSYFPQRTTVVLQQLRTAGLYPAVDAPVFTSAINKSRGDSTLSIQSSGGGTIYYTTDNSDPRVYGTGAVSPRAQVFRAPLAPSGTFHGKARVLRDGVWSALTEFEWKGR